MACFADINVSQGSVATYARCGGIFDIHLTANLPRNLSVKNFLIRLSIDRIMVMSLWPRFLANPVEMVRPGHWLGSLLWVSVSAKTLMDGHLAHKNLCTWSMKTKGELANPDSPGNWWLLM